MPITPHQLLKRLKPTPKFPVSEADIAQLTETLRRLSTEDVIALWKEASGVGTIKSQQSKSSSLDHEAAAASTELSAFRKEIGIKSDSLASAFIRFVSAADDRVTRSPTKTANSSIPAAIKWLSKEIPTHSIHEHSRYFVQKFSEQTDMTYQ